MDRFYALCGLLVAISLTQTSHAQSPSEPERIYSGSLSQTKTYMHQFVDSPDGSKYAFRYFPGEDQPKGRKGSASPCEIWICNSDLTGHYKAFTSSIGEGGHGSSVIAWVTDDLIFYGGVSFQLSTREIRWKFEGALPVARNTPVSPHKLYVNLRRDPERKGWYWIDPSSPSKPELRLVNDMRNLVSHYGGTWEDAGATYLYQNPSDTKLYVVVYDSAKRQEFAFVLNTDGSVHSYLGHNRVGYCANGHVLWYDDESLMAGNQKPGRFDLEGNLIEWLAPKGNHISLSHDKQWWVGDIYRDTLEVRLHRYGAEDYVVISGDVEYFGDFHPSFSRDGRYVFFQGKRASEPHPGVYRVDVSAITQAKSSATP